MMGRPYHEERDLAAVTRMWREVGWIDDSDAHAEALRDFLGCGAALVTDVGGHAECLVHRSPGTIRYDGIDLPLCAITAVTTSHVGRRQGLASILMAETLAAGAAEGAAVASLGVFEQGFYDRFGFGTGTYQHRISFDPSALEVPIPSRSPVRLGRGHIDEMHALLARRHRGHGAVVLDPPRLVGAELAWTEMPVALGFRSDDGRLTHFLLGSMKDEYGPFVVELLAFEEPRQVLDLFGLLRSLGDQFALVTVNDEPAGIQLQDLIGEPLRQQRWARMTGGHGTLHDAMAMQQDRILDLGACIGAVHLRIPPVAFGLRLQDPMSVRAEDWAGVGGDYTVRLGASSTIDEGLDPDLPVLEATVNAFTRLWLGVRPANGLALTDDLSGPAELLNALDDAFRLPVPRAGWSF